MSLIKGKIQTGDGRWLDIKDLEVGTIIIDQYGLIRLIRGICTSMIGQQKGLPLGENTYITEEHPFLELGNYCATSKKALHKKIHCSNGIVGRFLPIGSKAKIVTKGVFRNFYTFMPTYLPVCDEPCEVKFGNGIILLPGEIGSKGIAK